MQRALVRTWLHLVALCAAICFATRASTAFEHELQPPDGLGTPLGIAGLALDDWIGITAANPAALASTPRNEVLTGTILSPAAHAVASAATLPSLQRPVVRLGLAYWNLGSKAQYSRWSLSNAGTWRSSVAWGGTLKLQSSRVDDRGDTSFDLDVGTLVRPAGWKSLPRWAAQLHTAVVLHDVVAASPDESDAGGPQRALSAALAWSQALHPTWLLALAGGMRTSAESRRQAAAGVRLRWQRGGEIALGLQAAKMRVGAALHRSAWSAAYAVAPGKDATRHELALRIRWGHSLPDQGLARERQHETEVAARIDAAVQEYERLQLRQWLDGAAAALDARQYAQAQSLAQRALDVRTDNVEALHVLKSTRHAVWVQRADSLMQRRDYAGSARALEEALGVDPTDSLSTVRLREVRRAATNVARLKSETTKELRAGIDAYTQQRYGSAAAAFKSVLAVDPNHSTATSYLERTLQAQKTRIQASLALTRQRLSSAQYAAARTEAKRLLLDEPGHEEALELLTQVEQAEKGARLALVKRRRDEARRRVEQKTAEDAAPATPPAAIVERYSRGMQLYRSGNLDGAMHAWEEVAAFAPHYQDVDKNLLRVYHVTGLENYTEGRLRQAVEIWEKALALDPDNRQLRRYLMQANAKMRRSETSETPNESGPKHP